MSDNPMDQKLPEGYQWVKVAVPVPPTDRLSDGLIGTLAGLAAEAMVTALKKRRGEAK